MAPKIFDRAARRAIAARAAASPAGDRWLLDHIVEEALLRLKANEAGLGAVLVTGPASATLARLLRRQGAVTVIAQGSDEIVFDEDRPPFADRSFDTIVAAGGLDTVNDLPGALIRFRQMLKPGGLFAGTMPSAGSLTALRAAMQGLSRSAHFHPQIDVRAAGDLLARAGFAVPVADLDRLDARYANLGALLRDLRANALSSVLPGKRPLPKPALAHLTSAFSNAATDGKTVETFHFVHFSGRAPASSL